MRVFDTSSDRPLPSELRPGDGIIVYASRTASKCASSAECDNYRKRGIIVGWVFEDQTGRAVTGSFTDGVNDGALSLAMGKHRGMKEGEVHYVASDTSGETSISYARGFAVGLTAYTIPGLYAGDRNLERIRTNLRWSKFWQAGASSWSNNWAYDENGN